MRVIRVAALLALCACGTDPDDFGRCTGNIALEISHEPNPVFAWTPADCQMHQLEVVEDQSVKWLMESDVFLNQIPSGIRYGDEVPGLINVGAAPLYSGFFYTVGLWRVDGEGVPHQVVSQRFQHQVE